MDRKMKRNEAIDRKNNKTKDRGDLNKTNESKVLKKHEENMKAANPGSGDSARKPTPQKSEKMKLNLVMKKATKDELKLKNFIDSPADKYFSSKKNNNGKGIQSKTGELELRKRIRDKYTLKLRSPVHKSEFSNLTVKKKDDGHKVAAVKSEAIERPKQQIIEEAIHTKEPPKVLSPSLGNTDSNEKKADKSSAKPDKHSPKPDKSSGKRRPMIKTITSRSDSVRIFKAVTFVEDKTPTPLEIKIPVDSVKKQKVSKYTDTSSLKYKPKPTSPVIIEEKPVKKKIERKKKIKQVNSPGSLVNELMSPPTEVARWAPASVDQQTKPYYEAWVNTTLAAISKNTKADKLFYEKQKRNILLSFQKALLQRPRSPELFYENFADEKYTGRIKITQR